MSAETSLSQSIVFLYYFDDLPDHRQPGKVMYPLDEILLLCLLGVLAGAETIVDIARFGVMKLEFLRRFRPFQHGTPSHDHLGDVLARLDPDAFQRCFIRWVAARIGVSANSIAIDGKTLRRAFSKKEEKEPVHIVSAFSAAERLVLGHVKVSEKTNEITAIPKLLDLIDVKGATITIDAMGCQRAIARKIEKRGAHYILALKGNQTTLHSDIALFVAEQREKNFADTTITVHHDDIDKNHGRIETRRYTVIHDVSWLQSTHHWPALESVIVAERHVEISGKTRSETMFYIASTSCDAATVASLIRGHWRIENSLHWVMDMVFRDDECRLRTDHAPANFTTIRHMAANLLVRAPGKDSIRLRRKTAGWDERFLESLIAP